MLHLVVLLKFLINLLFLLQQIMLNFKLKVLHLVLLQLILDLLQMLLLMA